MSRLLRAALPAFAFLLSFALCSACTPRQEIASASGLYVSGRANFAISVAEGMKLATSSWFSSFAPSDVTVKPSGRFRYALFSDSVEGPVERHAHVILGELPSNQWVWEKETWAKPEALSYEKDRKAGKYWTIQVFPVFSSRDWFSRLWQANGRQTPDFWLAKRWSSTPEDYLRIVAEYREPAPLCMRERLAGAEQRETQGVIEVKGKELWRNCDKDIEEFNSRADSAFLFDRAKSMPDPAASVLKALPHGNPDIGKLVGKSEYKDTFHSSSGD